MYIYFVFVFFTFLAYVIGGQIQSNVDLIKSYRKSSDQTDLLNLSATIKQFYDEKRSYPTSISSLASTSGYEQSRSMTNAFQSYVVSGTIVDSVWSFQRAVVFNVNRSHGATDSSYGLINNCGSGSITSGSSWCGQPDSLWSRLEARDEFNAEITVQRTRQQRLLQRLASYFNNMGNFPNKDQSSANMVSGLSYSVAVLVGYGGSGGACSGTFSWLGVPIDCSDMFDIWGNAINYAYFGDKHIALVSSTPILNRLGQKVQIAADLDAS
jgi:hypothetical protein